MGGKVHLFLIFMNFFAVQDGFLCSSFTRENSNKQLLWWNPFIENYREIKTCQLGNCLITDDRNILNDPNTGILFYGSDFKGNSLPNSRKSDQIWALLHEESPKNNPLLCHKEVIELFNFSSTYKESSDIPLTLQYLSSIQDLTDRDRLVSVADKNSFQKDGLGAIIYIQSDCDPPSQRDVFVKELSKYVKIDSYGACLKNKSLAENIDDGVEGMWHEDLKSLISKYKFSLALENAADDDYVTEKLWRPLVCGTVPIYWGAPNVQQWTPNKDSIVHVRDFSSVRDIADYINYLDRNDVIYEKYLRHKMTQDIENEKLVRLMRDRHWGVNNDHEKMNFIEHFECEVCNALYSKVEKKVAKESSYNCKEPRTVMDTFELNKSSSHWADEWLKSFLEAKLLRELLQEGRYSSLHYDEFFLELLIEEGHYGAGTPTLEEGEGEEVPHRRGKKEL